MLLNKALMKREHFCIVQLVCNLVNMLGILYFLSCLSMAMGQQVFRFDADDIKSIVQMHNQARRAFPATAMKKLTWSIPLAEKAAEIVLQCHFHHSVPFMDATKLGYDHIGENVFAINGAKPSAQMIIKSFLKEQSNFDPATRTCIPGKRCGHYTQMMWASTEVVGCAMSACDDIPGTSWSGKGQWIIGGSKGGYLATCLYGPGGNYLGEKPFVPSSPLSPQCTKCSLYDKKGISYICDNDGLCVKKTV